MGSVFASSLNLLILVVFMVYKLRGPILEFVSQRHHTIRNEIKVVREQLQQAQEKYDEFSAKLKAIDAEVIALREQAKQDVVAMKQRVVNESRRMGSIIATDARGASQALFSELKGQLYTEWSHMILDRAEGIIKERLTDQDQARIRKEFTHEMEIVK